jgi:hypothetical protein
MKLGLAFVLVALGLILPNAYAATSSIEVNGVTHEVTYEATGLTVEGIEADTNTATLSVLVTTTDVEGTLVVDLNRSFFDSKTDGTDDDFLVLADTDEALFVDEKTDSTRTLTITVPSGTNSVDIISLGTTNFGAGESAPETPVEEPAEEPESTSEPEPEAPIEEPEPTQCGPGTILQDGQCVLEQVEPVAEEPAPTPVEESIETPQASQCGPGTVLKDGECVLDQTCGPGTILQDGQCVLDTTAQAPAVSKSQGTQLAIGIVAAFVVSFIVMIVLWAIGKAGRSKN